jgi:hypothetical protein
MAFGEVGGLLEQKVHRDFKPRCSRRYQEAEVSLGIRGRTIVVSVGSGLIDTYNSTPEIEPRLADDWSGAKSHLRTGAGQLTVDLCL